MGSLSFTNLGPGGCRCWTVCKTLKFSHLFKRGALGVVGRGSDDAVRILGVGGRVAVAGQRLDLRLPNLEGGSVSAPASEPALGHNGKFESP